MKPRNFPGRRRLRQLRAQGLDPYRAEGCLSYDIRHRAGRKHRDAHGYIISSPELSERGKREYESNNVGDHDRKKLRR